MKGEEEAEAEEKKSKLISNFTQLKPVVYLSSKNTYQNSVRSTLLTLCLCFSILFF